MRGSFDVTALNVPVDAAVLAATLTAAGYIVAAPLPPPPPSGAPTLKVVFAQNGETPLLPQDYSYTATITRDFPGGHGNANCIKVVAGTWGGFQPSNDNGKVTDFSLCNIITVDVFAPKGWQGSVQFLKGGDLPIAGVKGNHFTKLVDGWETFTWPALQLMSDNGVDVRKTIYKGAVESQNNVPTTTYYVDNWGGI
jgi:hypothetical protein